MVRTFVLWLGLTLGAGSLWAPTVASMEALEAASQWQQAQGFARQYRVALRSDSVRLTDSLAFQIVRIADHYGIARRVAFGMVWTESRFKVDALGRVGDVGLAQAPPSTGRRVCGIRAVRELYQPVRNLDCGFRFYAQLFERYGAVDWLALVAYNRGPRIEQAAAQHRGSLQTASSIHARTHFEQTRGLHSATPQRLPLSTSGLAGRFRRIGWRRGA